MYIESKTDIGMAVPNSVQCMYVYVITPLGVMLVYPPERGGQVKCNTTTKGVVICLLPLLGSCLDTTVSTKFACNGSQNKEY